MKPHLSWHAPQYHHTPKSRDWYTAVYIIAFTAIVLAILLGNYIFAIFLFVSVVALLLHSTKPPETVPFEINNKGVIIKDVLFPFSTLDSFWVETEHDTPKILLKSKKFFMPYIILPIHEEDADSARAVLLAYLKEEEHSEPFTQKVFEYFGF